MKDKKLLEERGAGYGSVYLAELGDINIIPLTAVSGVLVSDASLGLFEFAARNKAVV